MRDHHANMIFALRTTSTDKHPLRRIILSGDMPATKSARFFRRTASLRALSSRALIILLLSGRAIIQTRSKCFLLSGVYDAGLTHRLDREAAVAASNLLAGNAGLEVGQVFAPSSVLASLEFASTDHVVGLLHGFDTLLLSKPTVKDSVAKYARL